MVATAARKFVPPNLDASDISQLQPLYQSLIDRPTTLLGDLEHWLADFSELSAVIDEFGSRRYIDKSCHTDDRKIESAFLNFVENVEPKIKPLHFRLQKKLLDSPALSQLDPDRYGILIRQWKADVEVYRDENVPIETHITKLVNDYDKLCGAMMVEFRGGQYTPQQMAKFQEEPDRETRRLAWEANTQRRLQNRRSMEDIFDQLLPLHQQIARNAAMQDFRQYAWKSKKRFDYTAEDCLRFADAIAAACVPRVAQLNAQRARELGVSTLRPWDLDVDVKGRPALRPFKSDQTDLLFSKTREIFSRLSPQLASDFDQLRIHNNLDLESRKGKQPGGYQCALEESGQPFIFMNAAGLQRDVETLLHEGGHAFHYLAAAAREPIIFLRHAPMEFCEVASMSMELLGSDHLEVFYDEAQAARARRKLMEGIIRFLPWMATIDSFQHWIYTHPGHTSEQRTDCWLSLMDRFGGGIDWSGHESALACRWQQQRHLFHQPFYYIEYGIAQLGAVQLWLKSRHDPRQALANYRAALSLGGKKGLPQLFSAAGINFDFTEKTLRPLMDALSQELQILSD
jgi:oligoendopeptidase F